MLQLNIYYDASVHEIVGHTSHITDFNTSLSPYDGQVVLCPPQLIGVTNKWSTSFGAIGVRLHDKLLTISQPAADSGKESQPLGVSEADAICRQLEYTGVIPGSVRILRIDNVINGI